VNKSEKAFEAYMAAKHDAQERAEFEEVPVIGVFHPICVLGYIMAACIVALAVLLALLVTGH